ncbi:hypothetical protein H5410_030905 [Solanum commersonii]|uniref:Putative plant transposon protein domain-containing protein n=1 Tax=Solanum commersonii TaxID=4109 RepID=A0A9J5YIA3_SOLCO|nr:hypothetical protein H5410_030905 [Solanum commersonii]
MLQAPSLPILHDPSLPMLQGPMPNHPPGLKRMIKQPRLTRQLAQKEHRVLTGSLHTVPDIHRLFNLYKCDWMARDPGMYSEEIVRELYASYAATLRGSISKWSKPLAQAPLTSTLVQGCPMDIPPATIRRFLYGPTAGHSWYITADGERAKWVAAPRLGIRKATLNFVAKLFLLLVRNRVSLTKTDNQVTWDRAVMVAALVAGVEIDFTRMDSGVSIWHCDKIVHLTGALDIGLIRDEANVAAPRKEPQVEVPPLGADLVDTVGQAQGDDLRIPDHTDTVPSSSSQVASMAPSSSRSTRQLGATVVPLARVQKLEAQMATLLHHIQP